MTRAARLASGWASLTGLAPGALVCLLVAWAAAHLSHQLGGPTLLYALLLGLSLHFLSEQSRIKPGLDFAARTVLRTGVALLGFRISLPEIVALGPRTALMVVMAVGTTVVVGVALARWMKRPVNEGLISGGSVAICGASAALAVASVLPQTRENERHTLLVVVGVTILSTVAMVLYPIFTQWMAWTPLQSGFFLGATIHDVAQVVGAASLLEPQAGGVALQTATITKLARVVLLMPVVIIIHAVWKESRNQDLPEQRTPIVPGFLVAFLLAVLLHTAGWVPEALAQQAGDLSRTCLVIAIAGVGIKTRFQDLLKLGWLPLAMLVGETLWIALLVGTLMLTLGMG